MKTASFFTYTGPGRISIARWAPPGHPPGYRVYRPLNPRREWMRLAAAEFDPVYRGMLATFDPEAVWRELHWLVNGGARASLLGTARPTVPQEACRHMVPRDPGPRRGGVRADPLAKPAQQSRAP